MALELDMIGDADDGIGLEKGFCCLKYIWNETVLNFKNKKLIKKKLKKKNQKKKKKLKLKFFNKKKN